MSLAALTYALIPVLATLIGGVFAAFRAPGRQARSLIQHFAAGVVFAAVAGELVPELMQERERLAVIVGMALGVGVMLGVKRLTEGSGKSALPEPAPGAESPTGLLITIAIDVFVDGLLVGIGFAAGAQAGLLLTLALSVEALFLGLAASSGLSRSGATRGRMIATAAGLALLLGLGAAIGGTLLSGLVGFMLVTVLAFGAAALLYLVTEELLVEAHEGPESATGAATFFAGFLVLFLAEMTLAGPAA